MAVVAQLSVNLAAQTAAYEAGLKKAGQQTKAFESQVTRTVNRVRQSFRNLGGRLSPLGLGPGAITGLGAGFAAARFTTNSLRSFADTKEGAELKSTMDALNKSVEEVQVNFGRWLTTTLDLTAGLKTLGAGINALTPTSGAAGTAAISGRAEALQGDPSRQAAEQALRANLSQQSVIQQQIKEASERMASGGFFRSITRLVSDQIDSAAIKQLESELSTLQLEESTLLPAAGFASRGGGGIGQRSGGATLPDATNGVATLFEKLPGLIDQGFNSFANFSKQAVDGLNQIDSVLNKAESDLQDFMAGFKITEGQRSPLELFNREVAELQRLLDGGFITQGTFDLAFLDARKKLEDFAGLNDPLPGRVAGARRGSVDAFSRIAAFEDKQNNPVQRTLEETKEIAKQQLKALEELAAAASGNNVETIDTKP